jgi:hypothetical protein
MDMASNSLLRLLPSQTAQDLAASAIARVLGELDAATDPEACKWHGLRQQDRDRLEAAAKQMVTDYLLDVRQAHTTEPT